MGKEKNIELEDLVKKWTAFFIKKAGDLFDTDELKQEIWVAILKAEKTNTYDSEKEGASKEKYLNHCIFYHIKRLLREHIEQKREIACEEYKSIPVDAEIEEIVYTKELLEKLKGKISDLGLSPQIIEERELKSLRELGEKYSLSHETIRQKIKKIKKTYDELEGTDSS